MNESLSFLVHILRMANISLDQGHMTCINVILDKGGMATGEVIDDHHAIAPRNQSVNEMRTDEACATGDQYFHFVLCQGPEWL